jgi:hypothetical protein
LPKKTNRKNNIVNSLRSITGFIYLLVGILN